VVREGNLGAKLEGEKEINALAVSTREGFLEEQSLACKGGKRRRGGGNDKIPPNTKAGHFKKNRFSRKKKIDKGVTAPTEKIDKTSRK